VPAQFHQNLTLGWFELGALRYYKFGF